VTNEQITRNAAAIAGAVKMLEREIASFVTAIDGEVLDDEGARTISGYLTELHQHFVSLLERADRLESEARVLLAA
jgi:hypothetical protein